ncbi:MAG TPA: methylmalonyl-CoA epimerase [Longimicrobiales bacterium]|nr:methylmalonyl-CoA epimerase [Longimicrobiales bacterium]
MPDLGLPIDHIAIAVPSIRDALPKFERLTGTGASGIETVAAQGVAVAFLDAGAVAVELIEPLSPDSSVARFLERRGAGLHHIAFRTPDVAAELERLKQAGVRLIDPAPRAGARGHRVAFLHPESFDSVLVELVQR